MIIVRIVLPFLLAICSWLMMSPAISEQALKTNKSAGMAQPELSTDRLQSALNSARDQLGKAFDSYRQQDLKMTRQSLQQASEWLNQSSFNSSTEKVKTESSKMAKEIEKFYDRIALDSKPDENSLVRFWHKTTSMIKRETDQLILSYINLSTAEKTLKHLLDAKMHFFTAEHDLFVSHDIQDSTEELNKVRHDLDKASQVATANIKLKIESLDNEIQNMIEAKAPTAELLQQDKTLIALDVAYSNLNDAKLNASPAVKLRLDSLQFEIDELRNSIDVNNLKKDYDSAMTRLKEIIHEL